MPTSLVAEADIAAHPAPKNQKPGFQEGQAEDNRPSTREAPSSPTEFPLEKRMQQA